MAPIWTNFTSFSAFLGWKWLRLSNISSAIILFSLINCDDKEEPVQLVTVTGQVQKGPFLKDSEVKIQSLNDELASEGDVLLSGIMDNSGAYKFEASVPTGYVEVTASGYYFNEVTGEVSESPVTLKALARVDSDKNINVNILTALAFDRVKYLMTEENMQYEEAQQTAFGEVLQVFNISYEEPAASFEAFDFLNEDSSGEILLAVSAIMHYTNSTGQLALQLSLIAEDIKSDGVLNNPDIKQMLNLRSTQFISAGLPAKIIEALKNYYDNLGIAVNIADFSKYIDSDGDGIIDLYDVKDPVFTHQPGTYSTDILVSIDSKTEGSIIRYTTDNSEPTELSPLYTAPIPVKGDGASVTIKAIAMKEGFDNSKIVESTFFINYPVAPYPAIIESAGIYTSDITVTLVASNGFDIYYTLDGTTPDTHSNLYTGAINISGDGKKVFLNAIAVNQQSKPSRMVSSFYAIDYNANLTDKVAVVSAEEVTDFVNGRWIGWVAGPGTGNLEDRYNVELVFTPTNNTSGRVVIKTLSAAKSNFLPDPVFGHQVYDSPFIAGTSVLDFRSLLKTGYFLTFYNGGNVMTFMSGSNPTPDGYYYTLVKIE